MGSRVKSQPGKFEQSERTRKIILSALVGSVVALYFLYQLIGGLGVEVVEISPDGCELVKDFESPLYESRREGIFKLKSKTANLGADTLYAPLPTGLLARRQYISGEEFVYVPGWAYKCQN